MRAEVFAGPGLGIKVWLVFSMKGERNGAEVLGFIAYKKSARFT